MPYNLSGDGTCVVGPDYRYCYGPEDGSLATRKRKARRLLYALRMNVKKSGGRGPVRSSVIHIQYPWSTIKPKRPQPPMAYITHSISGRFRGPR